jgi:hypothetical protein
VSRTIWVPDHGAGGSLHQPLEIPEPGEPGYMTPTERLAFADPGDPQAAIIAREQAIEEALELQALRAEAEPEPEAGL